MKKKIDKNDFEKSLHFEGGGVEANLEKVNILIFFLTASFIISFCCHALCLAGRYYKKIILFLKHHDFNILGVLLFKGVFLNNVTFQTIKPPPDILHFPIGNPVATRAAPSVGQYTHQLLLLKAATVDLFRFTDWNFLVCRLLNFDDRNLRC